MRLFVRYFIVWNLFALIFVCCGAQPPERDVATLYADFCSSCHGSRMEGGKGPRLIDGQWKHGGDHASLVRSIRNGYAAYGMPGFAATIDEAEGNAPAAYLIESATRRVDPPLGEETGLPPGVQRSEEHSYRIQSVAEGFDVPWSMAFLPDGRLLVTERAGRLRLIENGQLQPATIEGVPEVIVRDEGGLLSVVLDPDFAANHWVYLSFSDPGAAETAMTKIIRARLAGNRLVEHETIFSIPREKYQSGYTSFGGRLVFHDGKLFFSVGERGLTPEIVGQAQDLSLPNGKVHRIFPDGKIPPDNPFSDARGIPTTIWSYGNRNPQGLAIDPRTGDLWETEHGPRGGDELNLIQRGGNYGWPLVTFGMNYDGTPISNRTEEPGLEPPVIDWTPSIAVSEIEFYTGDRFPQWRNNLFVGSLAQQKLLRIVIEDGRAVHREEIFRGLGRIRDLKTGPDGLLYVALELIGKPGRIVRLVPAEPDSAANPP